MVNTSNALVQIKVDTGKFVFDEKFGNVEKTKTVLTVSNKKIFCFEFVGRSMFHVWPLSRRMRVVVNPYKEGLLQDV